MVEFFNYVIGKNFNYIQVFLKIFNSVHIKKIYDLLYLTISGYGYYRRDTITEYAYEVIREKFNIMKRVLKENFFSICLLK